MAAHSKCSEKNSRGNKPLHVKSEEYHIKIHANVSVHSVGHLAPCFIVSLKPETMTKRGEKKALWPWDVSFIDLCSLAEGDLRLVPASDLLQQSVEGKCQLSRREWIIIAAWLRGKETKVWKSITVFPWNPFQIGRPVRWGGEAEEPVTR